MGGEEGELRGPDTRVLDEDSGQYTYTPGSLKYAGIGKVQSTDAIGNDADAGDRAIMVTRAEVHLPIAAPIAAVDDVWTQTASLVDPQMVGRRFRIASKEPKSLATVRRLAAEETQS